MYRTSMNLMNLTLMTFELVVKTAIGIAKILYRLILQPIFRTLYQKVRYNFVRAYRSFKGWIAEMKAEQKKRARQKQELMQRCKFGRRDGKVIYPDKFAKSAETEQEQKSERRCARE